MAREYSDRPGRASSETSQTLPAASDPPVSYQRARLGDLLGRVRETSSVVERFFDGGPLRRYVWQLARSMEMHRAGRNANAMAFDLFLALLPMLALAGWALTHFVTAGEESLRANSLLADLTPDELSGIIRTHFESLSAATLAPVAANIRSDRTHYFANDRLDAEFWVCNDLPHELKGHRIAWQLRQGRKTVFAAQTQADVPALAPSCQGVFDFRLPDVAERTAFTLQLALKDRAGRIVHWTQRSFDVFPKLAPSSRKVYVLARQGGAAWKLALQLGLKPQLWNNQTDAPILVDSPAELRRHKSALNQAVRQGGRVVLTDLEMTEKDWNSTLTFANAKFTLQHPGMGPRYFANCSTSHPLVEGFQQDDFFLWHSTATDMIEPLMPVTMQAEGLQTILATGEGDWAAKTWNPAPAAALSHHGQGQFIVSLIALLDRVTTNPPAKRYALRLLNLT